jgi:hypothetical protein
MRRSAKQRSAPAIITAAEGRCTTVAIVSGSVACPVHVQAWLQAAGITYGSVFRSVAKSGRIGKARFGLREHPTVIERGA